MPPKRAPKKPLHELAPKIPSGFKFTDSSKKSFVLGEQFATGGFGRIYKCSLADSPKEKLCVKVEPAGNGPLFVETAVFQRALRLNLLQEYCKSKKIAEVGLPYMVASGIFEYKDEKLRYLVMPIYALSLESIREKSPKLNAKCALTVAKAMVRALDFLQTKDYTHGDIKAANILLPSSSNFDGAVLVDFGLARLASSNVEKADKKRAHSGTAIFTSLDAHRGFQPSYRGDIEILLYNIAYWISGSLPWLKDESNPSAVQQGKEEFGKNVEKKLSEMVGSGLAGQLAKIYRLAEKTPYTSKMDSDAVLKLLDDALNEAKKSSVSTPKAPSTKSKATSAKKETSTPKEKAKPAPRRLVVISSEEEDEEEEEEVVETKKRKVAPKAPMLPQKKNSTAKKESDDEEEVGRRSPRTAKSGGTKRQANRKDDVKPAKRPTLPVPGLPNGGRKEESEESGGEEGSSEDEDEEEEENATTSKGVNSAVKASKDELRRTVPGMRNLQKGRRSMIINEIAKKHKK